MATPRRVNLALLAVLPAAFATGWLAFGVGTLWPARIVIAAHAATGIAVVLLIPWKSLIVRRGLVRPRRSVIAKAAGVALGVLVLISLAAGFAHAYAGPHTLLGLSEMQIHVGAAIAAVPLFAVHIVVRRQRVRTIDVSRRSALRIGLLGTAGLAIFLAAEAVDDAVRGPGRLRRATGSYPQGTDDLAAMPQVAWLFDTVPRLDPDGFAVLLRTPDGRRDVRYAELAAGTDEIRAVLDCTGGWYAAATWRGVRLDRLIGQHSHGIVTVTSATGYRRAFPAAETDKLWLVTHAGGAPLDAGHGAPVRLVAPGRRGFWWVKWVASVEVETGLWSWQPPFPVH